MARRDYTGIAYITLDGDQIKWLHGTTNETEILLNGSHFHETLPVATLAFTALYLLLFVVVLWEYLRRRGPRPVPVEKGKKKYKYSVGTAMGCMILYFATDLTNRIEHEAERVVPAYWVAINIPLGCLASIADGLLLVYLWKRSPVEIKRAGNIPYITMIFAFVMYCVISFATKGAQIWNVVTQFTFNNTGKKCKDDCKVQNGIEKSLQIEQDLDSAATGMLLLFSIGYALFSIGFVRELPETLTLPKRISVSVVALASGFLARSTVDFAFTLIYGQFDHSASLGIQLLYVALWGFLSVCVYTSVVFVETTRGKAEGATGGPTYQTPQDFVYGEDRWQREKPQVRVGQGEYSSVPGIYYP